MPRLRTDQPWCPYCEDPIEPRHKKVTRLDGLDYHKTCSDALDWIEENDTK